MKITPTDRPIAALRQEAIDQLIMNYGHGKLSLDALERRLDEVLDANSHDRLTSLVSDLDLRTDEAYAQKKRSEFGPRLNTNPPQSQDVDYMIHVFGGSNRAGAWHVANTIRMFNVFGGAELDFAEARFSSRETHVKMLCLFGGANFYVPENINVVSKALCIFGGIDNRAPSTDDPSAPELVIEGLLLFGGARISVKRTMRQRLLEFANNVRETFAPTGTRY
jgi:hypothetical protein